VRPTVVAHEQTACVPKRQQRLDGLDVVVSVNDVGFVREVLQFRAYGNTFRTNLAGDLSELW
jgi:hypothetical protein